MEFQQPYQARYGHCDTFFTESEDDGIYAIRAEERERARAIGRMHQRALAEELSKATADEYQEDILDHMEHMEVGEAALSLKLASLIFHRLRPCLMSTQSTFRQRFSGS